MTTVSKLLGAVAALLVLTTALRAETISIVNKLDVALTNGSVTEKQDVELDSKPPGTINPGETGSFKISYPSVDSKNRHLNIKYELDGTDDKVGVVYRQKSGTAHCPKDHPDWVKETTTHCGGNKGAWTYTFEPE